MSSDALSIEVPDLGTVSGLLDRGASSGALLVLGHGAGAGMHHAFMAALAHALVERGVSVLRYQFPFMENGSKRPDPPAIATATVRAAVAAAAAALPDVPLFAGGKSFGGRMTSQAQAAAPLPGVRGLVFVGFPLHPAGKPAIARAEHLDRVALPMLFLQGTRDALAELPLVDTVIARLGARATLDVIDDADHAFHVRKSSGTDDAAVLERLATRIATWTSTGR